MNKLAAFIKNNASTILTICASIGVVGTGVLSARASVKAHKKIRIERPETTLEKIKLAAPEYIWPVLVGGATIACICGSHSIDQKAIAALANVISASQEQPVEDDILIFEEYSQRFFRVNRADLILAEYNLNRDFAKRGEVCLNDFYRYLGIGNAGYADVIGWSFAVSDEYYTYQWIEFKFQKGFTDDGEEYYILTYPFPPIENFNQLY